MRIRLELIALAEEQKLCKADLVDFIRQFAARSGESLRLTLNHFFRPFEVISAVILGLQRPEQRVVFQPMFLLGAELIECGPQILALPGFEVFPCCFEQADFERDHRLVVNHVGRKVGLAILRRSSPSEIRLPGLISMRVPGK